MNIYFLLKKRALIILLPVIGVLLTLSIYFQNYLSALYILVLGSFFFESNTPDSLFLRRALVKNDLIFWRNLFGQTVFLNGVIFLLLLLSTWIDRPEFLQDLQLLKISELSFWVLIFLLLNAKSLIVMVFQSSASKVVLTQKQQIFQTGLLVAGLVLINLLVSYWLLVGLLVFVGSVIVFFISQFSLARVSLPKKVRVNIIVISLVFLTGVASALGFYDTARFRLLDLQLKDLAEVQSIEKAFSNLALLSRAKKNVPTEVVERVFDDLLKFCPSKPRDNAHVIRCTGMRPQEIHFVMRLPETDIKTFLRSDNPYLQLLALLSMRAPTVVQDEEMQSMAALYAENRTLWTNVALVTLEQPDEISRTIQFSIEKAQ